MTVKQISVFVENTPGALQDMTNVLAKNDIDVRALSLAEAADFGIVRLIVNDVFNASTILKDAGYVHTLTPVVVVAIPDSAGGLHKVLSILADADINLEYMYSFLGGADGCAYMILRVADPSVAAVELLAKGVNVVEKIR